MSDPYDDEIVRAYAARFEETRAKFGIALPIVDWAAPQPRNFLACDEDELCKWVVERYPELKPFEFIIEDAQPGVVAVLFAGVTREPTSRFLEHRLAIELEDDLVWYTERVYFSVLTHEQVRDEIENDLAVPRMPRWVTRPAPDRPA